MQRLVTIRTIVRITSPAVDDTSAITTQMLRLGDSSTPHRGKWCCTWPSHSHGILVLILTDKSTKLLSRMSAKNAPRSRVVPRPLDRLGVTAGQNGLTLQKTPDVSANEKGALRVFRFENSENRLAVQRIRLPDASV